MWQRFVIGIMLFLIVVYFVAATIHPGGLYDRKLAGHTTGPGRPNWHESERGLIEKQKV